MTPEPMRCVRCKHGIAPFASSHFHILPLCAECFGHRPAEVEAMRDVVVRRRKPAA